MSSKTDQSRKRMKPGPPTRQAQGIPAPPRPPRQPRATKGEINRAAAATQVARHVPVEYLKEAKTRKIPDYWETLARQIINPNGAVNFVVAPDEGGSQVCTRHFRRVVDVTAAAYPILRAVMFPNLNLPGFISSSAGGFVPAAGPGKASLTGHMIVSTDTIDAQLTGSAFLARDGNTTSVLQLTHLADAAATTRPGATINAQAGSHFSMTFELEGSANDGPITINWLYFGPASVNWGALADAAFGDTKCTISPGAPPRSYDFNLGAAAVTAVGFSVTGTGLLPRNIKIAIVGDSLQIATGVNTSFAPAFAKQITDNNVTKGRVIGMSILATNTSSVLNNGGDISVGRVPKTFDPFSAYAAQMAKLPSNRTMLGPASKGGYVWWAPNQAEEWEVNDIAQKEKQYIDSDFLAIEIPDWPNGATFRLTFDWVVEFYTDNQLFEKILTPPATPAFASFRYALNLADAAMHNPDHIEKAKEYGRQAVRYAKEAEGFIRDYGPYLMAAIEVLGSLVG